MGHSVTLGGERVGSGNKNKIYLHNYERSTHNLSYDWLSTMGCGMLIPFMCELVTRDDKYEIDLAAGLRTIPAKGAMFGSFKLQMDVFQCPLRLYQALLHNNPLAIGLKANQVKFPKIRLYDVKETFYQYQESKAANNSLIKYLGISGIGTLKGNVSQENTAHRDLFGAHVLAYYDIFKNYYANKQEENAYTLGTSYESLDEYNTWDFVSANYAKLGNSDVVDITENVYIAANTPYTLQLQTGTDDGSEYINIKLQMIKPTNINEFLSLKEVENEVVTLTYYTISETPQPRTIRATLRELQNYRFEDGTTQELVRINYNLLGQLNLRIANLFDHPEWSDVVFWGIAFNKTMHFKQEEVGLNSFALKNIDDMRYEVLSFHNLGETFLLDPGQSAETPLKSPYYWALGDEDDRYWKQNLSGICVKTYQSDIFNNWLDTELIDGENGISAITAISTSEGSITIDQLQFQEKLYNLLNRIAVSGNTYQDYLDAAYTVSAKRFEESPIWLGGYSDEVMFEEILQTAPTENQPLGTIGGRGNLKGKPKGGKITVKIDEPSLLIGIVSLTPRIVYTQGNKWFNTEIDSLQDIHVPALDAIGFQNLMAEQLHSSTTIITSADSTIEERPIIGKIPAWLNYMTNYDQAYGDFAAPDGDGYMVLQRDYNVTDGVLQDATTYIDPAKYNYAFAYTKRDAQNFWVKIKCSIKARRLMSAKQIPTA